MIHYERWMSLPPIVIGVLALFALAYAMRPGASSHLLMRGGLVLAGVGFILGGALFGLTDYRWAGHHPLTGKILMAIGTCAGGYLIWAALSRPAQSSLEIIEARIKGKSESN